MRVGLLALGLCGCLQAPPEFGATGGGADAGAPADAVVELRCVSGSRLDLVYVSHLSVLRDVRAAAALSGMAVFVNPTEDHILLPGISVDVLEPDPALAPTAGISGAEVGITLPPFEAKGALADQAETVVLPYLTETWTDTANPAVSAGFGVSEGYGQWDEEGNIPVSLRVTAGDYIFYIILALVDDEKSPPGTALAAARATAVCP